MTCTYAVTIDSNGNYNVTPSFSAQVVGYEAATTLSRVCVPSVTALSNALSSASSSISSTFSQGIFGATISDI
jgi:choline transporter-like protein 2/4/5